MAPGRLTGKGLASAGDLSSQPPGAFDKGELMMCKYQPRGIGPKPRCANTATVAVVVRSPGLAVTSETYCATHAPEVQALLARSGVASEVRPLALA